MALVSTPVAGVEDLRARCAAAGLALHRPLEAADLPAVRAFLEEWLAVVDAADEKARAKELNRLLERWSTAPRLTDHDGSPWHLHFRADDLPVHQQVAALVSVGTALHLVRRGVDRLGRCAAQGCAQVWADTSRAGRQRYCSPGCGNREAVRRHRRHRRSADAVAAGRADT